MEETWELATLVMSGEEKYERWDWSGRHVRIRFEMFIATLTFFVASTYKVTGFSFLPLKLDTANSPSEHLIVIFTMLIALFFLFSFYFRSQNEISESANVDVISIEHLDSIDKNLSSLESNVQKVKLIEFQNIQEAINADTGKMLGTLELFNQSKADFEQNWANLFEVLDRYHNMFGKGNRITNSNPNPTQEEVRISKLHHNLIKDLRAETSKIEQLGLIYDFSKAVQALFEKSPQLTASTNVAVTDLNALTEQIRLAQQAFSEESLDVLKQQNTEILALKKEVVAKLNGPNHVEKIWLSYRIPLAVSSLVFVISLPFAIGKIFPSILNQKFCWCFL